ncbi:hypothetical protein PIB30_043595 [Stylosanthes scabra]|uniref:Protein kinase domain-containing protein n=1 Tax=Stylosanthes scabra TaxID=79078 RepID=A0ABU6TG77_9FABA|nr:hypothetical protein [Stylosanthes scabra]
MISLFLIIHQKPLEKKKSNSRIMVVMMNPILVLSITTILFLLFSPMAYSSESEVVKSALVRFMDNLAPWNNNPEREASRYWGWNLETDPCTDNWKGVGCSSDGSVKTIVLDDSNLSGTLDATSLCMAKSLQILSLKRNNLHGSIPEAIGNCKYLTRLYLSDNNFSGNLPSSLQHLCSLRWIHIARNKFTGLLSDKIPLSSLISFLGENNNFTGEIPDFDLTKLIQLNVSNNNLKGQIPDVRNKFGVESFSGNPDLCGLPLPAACPPSPSPRKEKRLFITDGVAIYSGYIILGITVVAFFVYKLARKSICKSDASESLNKKEGTRQRLTRNDGGKNREDCSCERKSGGGGVEMRSEPSIASLESGITLMSTSTLVVLSSRMSKAMRFEDLLRAPAELIGRGMHGSLYKVMLDNGVFLAVKRIKDWGISESDFQRRISKVSQVNHPLLLPPLAYYCSRQEKLLAYEYIDNGSLFNTLYAAGTQNGKPFWWGSRLNVAAKIAETLAYMHEELRESGIAHGNLKSSNILFNSNMEPLISEYGLMVIEHQALRSLTHSKSVRNRVLTAAHAYSTFKVDVYAFGVILLELVTGRVAQNQGAFDLVKWANSVVREEWSVQVFDKNLVSEGASGERMMSLLQIALKCINPSPADRPSMSEVALALIKLNEEEETSLSI